MYTSRDRKCHFQGHVTLTYKVNRQGHDICLYSIDFPELKNLRNKKKNHCCSMYTSRDRKCHFQGHVTLTYKVNRQGHDICLYSIDFSELKNLRNKKKIIAVACIQAEIESVTFKVTWPWRTRSPVKATTFAYMLLTFLSGKTVETKKNRCCSMYTSRDRKCHFQGHVTLTYKVTRQGHDIRLYFIDFPEVKKYTNKKKIIAVACIQAEIESVTFKVTWPWRTRSRVKVTTFAYILLTFLRWITLETKKNECSSVYTCQIITPFHFFQNFKNYDVIQGHGVTSAEWQCQKL